MHCTCHLCLGNQCKTFDLDEIKITDMLLVVELVQIVKIIHFTFKQWLLILFFLIGSKRSKLIEQRPGKCR